MNLTVSLVYGTKEFNILTQRDRHIEDRQNNDDWLDSSSGFVREECTIIESVLCVGLKAMN